MLVAAVVLVIALAVFFTLAVRPQDVPEADPVSPVRHLDERKAAIYENLRDLQFEYRVGKLSDADYQQTKLGLQKELAAVLAEIEAFQGQPKPAAPKAAPAPLVCPHCGAKFSNPMKFCGQCGKEMA